METAREVLTDIFPNHGFANAPAAAGSSGRAKESGRDNSFAMEKDCVFCRVIRGRRPPRSFTPRAAGVFRTSGRRRRCTCDRPEKHIRSVKTLLQRRARARRAVPSAREMAHRLGISRRLRLFVNVERGAGRSSSTCTSLDRWVAALSADVRSGIRVRDDSDLHPCRSGLQARFALPFLDKAYVKSTFI